MSGSPIDRIVAHFDAAGLRRFEVPEWTQEGDDEPFAVYAKPMTVEDKNAINRASEAAGKGAHNAFVETLVRMGRHADGTPMFDAKDKPALRTHADTAVIERIALKMMASATVEDQVKN